MKDYVLGVDVWEGNLDIDEDMLMAGGVDFIIPRLNSIDGGLHLDDNFSKQWQQAESFIRFPYFVYSPWVSGYTNFEWLSDNMPPRCKRVACDIEVRRVGYLPESYAREVLDFIGLVSHYWNPVIYSGGWFLSCLSEWPEGDYWWARYPYALYPSQSEQITWEELRAKLANIAWSPGTAPGPIKLWQCTADRYKLPGCLNRPVDINVWNGNADDLRLWVGAEATSQPWSIAITDWARGMGYTGPDPENVFDVGEKIYA